MQPTSLQAMCTPSPPLSSPWCSPTDANKSQQKNVETVFFAYSKTCGECMPCLIEVL